jgi:hypothetical protein
VVEGNHVVVGKVVRLEAVDGKSCSWARRELDGSARPGRFDELSHWK